ncbi:MAG: ribokinase [Acidaminobacteraceae bacterium]
MKKINVLGSLNMDLVTNVNVTPKVGETILGSGFSQIAGGKGANQAAAIGRLGGNVSMIGRVGKDSFADELLASLRNDNVDIKNVSKSEVKPTGTALIMVNSDGDNSIVVIPGANFDIDRGDICKEMLDGDYLVAQLETPLEVIESSFKLAKAKGIKTVLNPAPAKKLSKELLSRVDILIPNETEFEFITGHNALDEGELDLGVKKLIDLGTGLVLITLGSNGSVLCDGKEKKYFETSKVKAVDTTAAGDSFIGGLLYSLSNGKSIDESIVFASKVAALTVTRSGAQSSLPTLKEVNERYGV